MTKQLTSKIIISVPEDSEEFLDRLIACFSDGFLNVTVTGIAKNDYGIHKNGKRAYLLVSARVEELPEGHESDIMSEGRLRPDNRLVPKSHRTITDENGNVVGGCIEFKRGDESDD